MGQKIIMWKFTNIYIGHLQKENSVMSLLVLLIVKLTTYKAGIMGNIENDKTCSLSLKALQSYWKRNTERQVLKYTTEAGEAEAKGLRVPGQPGLHPASEKKLCFLFQQVTNEQGQLCSWACREGSDHCSLIQREDQKVKAQAKDCWEKWGYQVWGSQCTTCAQRTLMLPWVCFIERSSEAGWEKLPRSLCLGVFKNKWTMTMRILRFQLEF